LLQIPLQMQQNDNPEDGVRVVWDAPAPATGSRALRPGSFHRAYATDTRFT
jgi:hypothetical protein